MPDKFVVRPYVCASPTHWHRRTETYVFYHFYGSRCVRYSRMSRFGIKDTRQRRRRRRHLCSIRKRDCASDRNCGRRRRKHSIKRLICFVGRATFVWSNPLNSNKIIPAMKRTTTSCDSVASIGTHGTSIVLCMHSITHGAHPLNRNINKLCVAFENRLSLELELENAHAIEWFVKWVDGK